MYESLEYKYATFTAFPCTSGFRIMLFFAVLVLNTIFQFVSGQSLSARPDTPICLVSCVAANCPNADYQCVCVESLPVIKACVSSSCTPGLSAAISIGSQICGIVALNVIINLQGLQ